MNNAGVTDGGCPVVRLDQLLECPLRHARLLTLTSWLASVNVCLMKVTHKRCNWGGVGYTACSRHILLTHYNITNIVCSQKRKINNQLIFQLLAYIKMENDNLIFLRELKVCVCVCWLMKFSLPGSGSAQVAFLLTELFFVSVQEFEA